MHRGGLIARHDRYRPGATVFAKIDIEMAFPIKVCVVCGEEFELKPDKPGFANRCPECSAPDAEEVSAGKRGGDAIDRKIENEANEARRKAIRDLLYRKDS
jgi:hypothetical protein